MGWHCLDPAKHDRSDQHGGGREQLNSDYHHQRPARNLHLFSASSLVAGSPGGVTPADWRAGVPRSGFGGGVVALGGWTPAHHGFHGNRSPTADR